jgi:hypothetical protein
MTKVALTPLDSQKALTPLNSQKALTPLNSQKVLTTWLLRCFSSRLNQFWGTAQPVFLKQNLMREIVCAILTIKMFSEIQNAATF